MPLSTVRLFVRRFQPASSPHGCITEFFTSAKNARQHRLCFSTRAHRNRVQYDSWLATGRLQYRMETALLPASVPLLPPGQRECLLHLSTTRRGVSGVSSGETLPPDEETELVVEGEGKPGLVIVDGSMLLHRAHHRAAGWRPAPWWRQKGIARCLCVSVCVGRELPQWADERGRSPIGFPLLSTHCAGPGDHCRRPLALPLTLLLLIPPSAGVQLLSYLKLKPAHFVVSPPLSRHSSFPPWPSSQPPFLPLAAMLRCQG